MTLNVSQESPSTPESAAAGPDNVRQTVTDLRATFAGRRTRNTGWRIRQLRGIERLLQENEETIARAVAADLGRPAGDTWLTEIAFTKAEAVFARKRLHKWMRPRRTGVSMTTMPGRAWVQFEPLGLVLIIGPWNFPFHLTLAPLIAAVAAGNCAVIKPSEHAPESAAVLARLIPQYLDGDAVRVIEGDAGVTQSLLELGFDHAFFTGGTGIGRKVMEAAAAALTPVTLELGGKSPVIVTQHADIAVTARRLVWGKLSNSGQVCIAPDYVLVERGLRDALVDAITTTMRTFRADQESATMPIINRTHFDRLTYILDNTDGDRVVGGGTNPETLGIEPTVIVDPSPASPVMTNEIFGPILPVVTVSSLDEAIEFVNARPKPLALYLFTKSAAERKRVLGETSSGGAVVNHVAMHCVEPRLPFGGVGQSGIGAYHGQWGFEALSHRKAVLVKPFWPDPSFLYPPYTPHKLKILRRFF